MARVARKKFEEVKKCEIVNVVKITLVAGEGTTEDQVRKVIQYWDMEGNMIATKDPCLLPRKTNCLDECKF